MNVATLFLAMIPTADPAPVLTPEIPAVARPALYPGQVFDLSPDGKTLVTHFSMQSYKQFLRLWDVESGAAVNNLALGEREVVTSAKFSPDGKTLAVGMGDRRGEIFIRLIDAHSGKPIREFWGFAGHATVKGFSADGKHLLVYDQSHASKKSFTPQLRTWDVATAKLLTSTDVKFDHTLPTATPDGTVTAKLGDNREVFVTRQGEKPRAMTGSRSGNYHSLFLTPDGKRVIAGTHAWAEVFDTATGEKLRVLQPDGGVVSSIASADGGRLLFVAMRDAKRNERREQTGSVRVWDVSKPALVSVIPGLIGEHWKVQPTADGKRFVAISGSEWNTYKIEVWDTAAKKRLHELELEKGTRYGQAAVSPDGNWVAHVSHDKDKSSVRVWSTATGAVAAAVTKAVRADNGSLAFTPDSKRLITVGPDDYAEWDLATGKKEVSWIRTGPQDRWLGGGGRAIAVPGARAVFTVAPTGKRRQSYVLRLITEKKEWVLAEVWDRASHPVVSPDGRWVSVIGGGPRDEELTMLLKLNADGSPEMVKKPGKHYGYVYDGMVPAWQTWPVDRFAATISFSADGKQLFTGGTGHAVRVWDATTHEPKATLYVAPPARPGDVPSDWVAFTPAGHFVATPGGEKFLRFREASVSTWFGFKPATGTVSAEKLDHLRDPAKVKEALGGK